MRDTIDMAREVGIEFQHITGILGKETISTMGSQRLERIEQLVALVRADAIADERSVEREACAKVCEDLEAWNMDDPGSSAAKAIRARRNT